MHWMRAGGCLDAGALGARTREQVNTLFQCPPLGPRAMCATARNHRARPCRTAGKAHQDGLGKTLAFPRILAFDKSRASPTALHSGFCNLRQRTCSITLPISMGVERGDVVNIGVSQVANATFAKRITWPRRVEALMYVSEFYQPSPARR